MAALERRPSIVALTDLDLTVGAWPSARLLLSSRPQSSLSGFMLSCSSQFRLKDFFFFSEQIFFSNRNLKT